MVSSYDVEFYKKADGTEPAKDFILSLDPKMRAKVLRTIGLLEDFGPKLREPYSKALGNGIFELRAKVGNNITRTFYFFYVDKKIFLTNGFIKKTQTTPSQELTRAKVYRADFLNREGGSK